MLLSQTSRRLRLQQDPLSLRRDSEARPLGPKKRSAASLTVLCILKLPLRHRLSPLLEQARNQRQPLPQSHVAEDQASSVIRPAVPPGNQILVGDKLASANPSAQTSISTMTA